MSNIPEFLPIFAPITEKSEKRIDEVLAMAKKQSPPLQILTRTHKSGTCDKPTLANEERLTVYSFLSARRWNVKEAFKMILEVENLYNYYRIFNLRFFPAVMSIRGFDQEDLITRLDLLRRAEELDEPVGKICRDCNKFTKVGVHYWDKRGLPVVYFMLGAMDVRHTYKEGRKFVPVGEALDDYIVRYVTYLTETIYSICRYQDMLLDANPQPELDRGGLRRNFVTIVIDAKGLNDSFVYRPTIEVLTKMMSKLRLVAPDCVHRILMINSPPSIRFFYAIVKPVIDSRMEKKIAFLTPEQSIDALDRVIGLDRVPSFLGGKCRCANGCIQDYVPGAVPVLTSDSTDVITEYIKIGVHDKFKRTFQVAAGESVTWDFASSKGVDVRFSVHFYRATTGLSMKPDGSKLQFDMGSSEKEKLKKDSLVKSAKLTDGSDHYDAKENGFLQLVWDNSKSWIQDKPIQMRVYKGSTMPAAGDLRSGDDA